MSFKTAVKLSNLNFLNEIKKLIDEGIIQRKNDINTYWKINFAKLKTKYRFGK